MKTKPWPIVILAFFQLFSPLASILISSWAYRMPVDRYLNAIFENQSFGQLVSFFFLVPFAGLAIYAMKRWSYPVFICIMGYVALDNYWQWKHSADEVSIAVLFVVYGLNIFLVTYFLLPTVRTVYFNPRIRWWESKPRYVVAVPAQIKTQNNVGPFAGVIQDISEGGLFLESKEELKTDESVEITTELLSKKLNVQGKVVYRRGAGGEGTGVGVQFVFRNWEEKQLFRDVAKTLDKMGLPRRPERIKRWDHFKAWAIRGITTGQGFFPEIPRQMPSSQQKEGSWFKKIFGSR